MKDAIKLVVTHFFIITVSVMFVISVSNSVAGVKYYSSDFPWQIIITGIITALPTFLFYSNKEPTKKQYIVRFIIHFILIETIVMIEGWILNWYSTFLNGLIIFGMVVFVYAVVLAYTYFVSSNTAKSINKALEKFNADENN